MMNRPSSSSSMTCADIVAHQTSIGPPIFTYRIGLGIELELSLDQNKDPKPVSVMEYLRSVEVLAPLKQYMTIHAQELSKECMLHIPAFMGIPIYCYAQTLDLADRPGRHSVFLDGDLFLASLACACLKENILLPDSAIMFLYQYVHQLVPATDLGELVMCRAYDQDHLRTWTADMYRQFLIDSVMLLHIQGHFEDREALLLIHDISQRKHPDLSCEPYQVVLTQFIALHRADQPRRWRFTTCAMEYWTFERRLDGIKSPDDVVSLKPNNAKASKEK